MRYLLGVRRVVGGDPSVRYIGAGFHWNSVSLNEEMKSRSLLIPPAVAGNFRQVLELQVGTHCQAIDLLLITLRRDGTALSGEVNTLKCSTIADEAKANLCKYRLVPVWWAAFVFELVEAFFFRRQGTEH